MSAAPSSRLRRAWSVASRLPRDAAAACLELFKIMAPIVVAVRLLQQFGVVEYLAAPLAPLMALVGLPPEMGLVWATAMLNTIYSALIVFAQLAPELTQAQVTVLATMVLVAHSIPVELKIARKAGPRMLPQLLLRLGGALLLGAVLNLLYASGGWLTEPAVMLWSPPENADASWTAWSLDQLRNFGLIYLVVLGLMAFLRLLDGLGITALMHRLLGPVLACMGIGREASSITIIGLTLGISYGGGLIIHEARTGGLPHRDVFYSLSLMGLAHSMFEDTLLMMLLGAHLSGIFWGRLLFALLAVALLVRLTRALPDATFQRRLGTTAG